MKLTILAFGIAKDIFGSSKLEVEIAEGATVQDLKTKLESDFDALKRLKSYFIAVDEEYADENQALSSNNEIALIPPVSGG